jgi:ATP-dependent exoDNAse (exonuclease V) beta subunit
MTIHKSKGLGFDVVFLPYVSNDKIPHEGRFDVARGDGWICKTPPSWVRGMSEEMKSATIVWEADQQYEAMCLLYVALTRAKRGLYLYLPLVDKKKEKSSHAHWIFQSMHLDEQSVVEVGKYENLLDFPATAQVEVASSARLLPAQPIQKSARASHWSAFDAEAAAKGQALHKMWSALSWLDEAQASDIAWFTTLDDPQLVDLLSRKGRNIALHREVPIDGIIAGQRMHAMMDRLHIHYDANQDVVALDLIEWKSDAHATPHALLKRYENQWSVYKTLLGRIWPTIPLRVFIVTHDGAMACAECP